jgi:methyl-accepting chemotaxis protein
LAASDSAPRDGAVGPLLAVGDTVYFALSTPVLASHSDTLGYLTQYRRVGLAGTTSRWIEGFIGPEAMVALGNRRGGVWTDLTHAMPAPAASIAPGRVFTIAGAEGAPSLAVATPIEGTPWVALVAMPRRHLLAPAQDLLGAMALLAAIVLAGGALAAWLLSRQIADPLADLTCAAEGIARGDYTRRVAIARDDELGRLAASFNSMASQVQESTHTLEHRVTDRTQELERTLRELRAAQDELV